MHCYFDNNFVNESTTHENSNEMSVSKNKMNNSENDKKLEWLSRHPETWAREQVKSWLNWCAHEYALLDIPFNKFEMNGKALCMLNEDMFKKRVPNSGDILYQALQNLIPKVAYNSTTINYQLDSYNGNNNKLTNLQQTDNNMLDITTNNNSVNNCFIKNDSSSSSIAQFNDNNSDNEDDNNLIHKNNKLIIDENSNNSENNYKFNNNNKRSTKSSTTPVSSNTTNNFERKRTANLENVIGNLINRKLVSNSNSSTNVSSSVLMSTNDEMASNEYAFSQPLSPSASSTSSSISQSSSQSPSKQNKKNNNSYSNEKWRMEATTDNNNNKKVTNDLINLIHAVATKNYDNAGSADSANGTASSPSSTRCDQDSDTLKEHMSTPVSSCASDNGHPPSPLNNSALNEYTNILIQSTSKAKGANHTRQQSKAEKAQEKINIEDPTRQIKFYDDFIDFRGDVLKRPPGAKNCRILWEYLYLLLQDKAYSSIIRWEDSVQMVFRIVQAEKLAALWGLQKNRLGMTYEKLSRGMRYYYPNNIIAREPGRRLLYRFMRHPDDIKKSVKKNGTYMLKRAKLELKNGKSITETTTSTTTPSPIGNRKNSSKTFEEDEELEDESLIEEAMDENIDEDVDNKNRKIPINNNNDDDSGLDETSTISPQPEKIKKFNNNENNDHSEKKNNSSNNNNKKKKNINNSDNNQQSGLAQNFYPSLYPFLTAQMAAAAAALQQQQQPQQQSNNFFNRGTNNEEVLAAHFLMQLRNQNSNELGFNTQNSGLLNLENVTNKLAAAAAAANVNASTAAAVQLNLQQIFSNSNESFLNQRNNSLKSQMKLVKQEEVDFEDDNSKSNNKNNKNSSELPLNLCVNNKKHKLSSIKKEKTCGENQENSNKNAIEEQQQQIDETKNIE